MKKLCVLLAALLLTGCGAQETLETVADDYEIPAMAEPREISVELPGEATISTIQSDSGRIYICDDYEIILETMEAGDLRATVESVSGRSPEELTLMKTENDGVKRYEFVWAAAGEKGEEIGQSVILDDGNYHYVLSVQREAEPENPCQVIWSRVFQSFHLI